MGDLYGIRCPRCQSRRSKVLYAREGKGYIRRRHACKADACERERVRWTTYEFLSERRGVITVPGDRRAIRSMRETLKNAQRATCSASTSIL